VRPNDHHAVDQLADGAAPPTRQFDPEQAVKLNRLDTMSGVLVQSEHQF
jgi:hypothetical protein